MALIELNGTTTNGVQTRVVNSATVGPVEVTYYADNNSWLNIPGNNNCKISMVGSTQETSNSNRRYLHYYSVVAAPGDRVTLSFTGEVQKYSLRVGFWDDSDSIFSGSKKDALYLGCSITFTMPSSDILLNVDTDSPSVSGSRTDKHYRLVSFEGSSQADKQTIAQLQSQVSDLNNQINNANNTINSLNHQVNVLTNERNNLQSQLNAANGQISNLTSEKNSLQSQLNVANSNINSLNRQIESLNAQIAQHQATIAQLNATIESKNEEIEDLKHQLEDATESGDSTSESLQIQINQLISDLDKAKDTIAKHEATIANLNKQIEDKDTQITLLNKQIESLTEDKRKLNNEIDRLNNTINDLNRQITVLKNQIANSGNNNSALLEELAIAQEELVKLKADYEERIIAIEKKLSATYYLSSDNKSELETIKQSVVKDIMAQIGTPRFGIAPLPIGKQAIATTNELLSDPSTGHIYLKNKAGLVSKTKDNENRLNLMDNFIKSTWIAGIVDYSNYSEYTASRDLYANSDGTFGTQTKIIALEKIPVKYSPMTEFIIAVKYARGSISKAVFVNNAGTELPCQKMYESNKTVTYKLYNDNVTAKTVYPKLIVPVDTAIESILVYRTMSLKSLEEQDNSTLDPSLNPDVIVDGIYNKENKEFTVNSANKLKIMIPKDSIKCGHTNLIVVAKDNNATITCKTFFNNSFKESRDVNFGGITSVNSLKTGYARFEIPEMPNGNNWLEITTTSSANVVIKHIVFDTIGIDLDLYYTKKEINDNSAALQNSIIQQLNNTINTNVNNINTMIRRAGNNFAVTGGNGSSYYITLPNVNWSDLVDGFTVCVVPHVINNAYASININNIGTYQIRNLNGEPLEAEYIKAGVPILMVKYGNYFFIRARFNLNTNGDDPTVKPGGGIDGPSKEQVIESVVGSVNSYTPVYVIRTLSKNLILAAVYFGYKDGSDVYQINLDSLVAKKVISNCNGDKNDMMRKWKDKYYIFGTVIYDLKFNELKRFVKFQGHHTGKTKSVNHKNVVYSYGRQDNTLILDSADTNKLYYVEVVPREWDESHQHEKYFDNCYWYERCDVRIHRVNDDFSLTEIMYYSNPDYWNRSKVVAIKDNYMYCMVYKKEWRSSKPDGARVFKINMNDGSIATPGNTTTEFGNSTMTYKTYIYQAPCYDWYRSTSSTTQTYLERAELNPYHSQETNRYLSFSTEDEYEYSGNKGMYHRNHYFTMVYDVLEDREVYYGSYSDTKRNASSKRRYTYINDQLEKGGVTNNPQVFLSRKWRNDMDRYKISIFGLVDKSNFSVQEIPESWDGNFTSKYRYTISAKGVQETINGAVHTKFILSLKTWKL